MTSSAISQNERTIPLVIHMLMLLSIVTGITGIVAALVIYTFRNKVSPEVRSHLEFATHTFWIGLIAFVALFAFAYSWNFFPFTFIPAASQLIFLFAIIWVAVRSIMGLVRLYSGHGIPNPDTLGVPARV